MSLRKKLQTVLKYTQTLLLLQKNLSSKVSVFTLLIFHLLHSKVEETYRKFRFHQPQCSRAVRSHQASQKLKNDKNKNHGASQLILQFDFVKTQLICESGLYGMQRMMVTCVVVMIIRWHSHKLLKGDLHSVSPFHLLSAYLIFCKWQFFGWTVFNI